MENKCDFLWFGYHCFLKLAHHGGTPPRNSELNSMKQQSHSRPCTTKLLEACKEVPMSTRTPTMGHPFQAPQASRGPQYLDPTVSRISQVSALRPSLWRGSNDPQQQAILQGEGRPWHMFPPQGTLHLSCRDKRTTETEATTAAEHVARTPWSCGTLSEKELSSS